MMTKKCESQKKLNIKVKFFCKIDIEIKYDQYTIK